MTTALFYQGIRGRRNMVVQFVRKEKKQEVLDTIDHTIKTVRGCFFGTAVGDALGKPFEHVPYGSPIVHQGRQLDRVTDFVQPPDGPLGGWTDDTGSMLALASAMSDWGRPFPGKKAYLEDYFLERLGNTPLRNCGQALQHYIKTGGMNRSWGSGALVRAQAMATFTHLKFFPEDRAADLCLHVSMWTHFHRQAVLPALEHFLAIRSILKREECVPEDLFRPAEHFEPGQHYPELWGKKIRSKESYADYLKERNAPLGDIPVTTGLWMWRHVFERILGMEPGKPWAELPPFEDGVIAAVSDSFDRDTAGAVAGSLLGAFHGEKAIPPRWLDTLWERDKVEFAAEYQLKVAS